MRRSWLDRYTLDEIRELAGCLDTLGGSDRGYTAWEHEKSRDVSSRWWLQLLMQPDRFVLDPTRQVRGSDWGIVPGDERGNACSN
jgi:hypothetical protein